MIKLNNSIYQCLNKLTQVIDEKFFVEKIIRLCLHSTRKLLVPTWKPIRYIMDNNGTELELVVHTSNIVPERLDDRVWWTKTPVLTPELLTSVSADSSPRSYLFTPATVRYLLKLHQTVAQNPSDMWRSTFEFGAASLRYRNRAEITVSVCKQNPYPLWFPCGSKSTMRA